MSLLFGAVNGGATFNEDISAWDTSGVTNMFSMFFKASAFNQPIGDWRVDKVTSMGSMFQAAKSFNQNLSGWDVDHVDDLSKMFFNAESFNQELGWCLNNPEVRMDDSFEGAQCGGVYEGGYVYDSCGVHSNETQVEYEAHINESSIYWSFTPC
jgi:hypothetical protein